MVRVFSCPVSIGTIMGSNMANVPHEVPVAKLRTAAARNTIAGKKLSRPGAAFFIIPAIKLSAPKSFVIPPSVHAKVRIIIGGAIVLKPSGNALINLLNDNTPLGT